MYVDTSKIKLRKIDKTTAKKIIVDNHYSHKFSHCRYALGIFYVGEEHRFFNEKEEKLIGCVIYGHPVGRRVIGSIFKEDILLNNSVLELTRLFIYDGYGKNIESYVISKSFKWLKQFDKNVKVLISYADPDVNHAGGIYQATNWIYQGCGDFQMAPTYSLRVKPEGEWIHSRTVYSIYGSADPKKLVKAIGHTFWLKKEASKHRYLYFLGNKKENKRFIKVLKHPMKKYPKENLYKTEITEHKIEKDLIYV